jgi:hypothetical protein
VPILRELTSWTSFLNNGFSKSGRIMHAFNIKCIAHLQIVFKKMFCAMIVPEIHFLFLELHKIKVHTL